MTFHKDKTEAGGEAVEGGTGGAGARVEEGDQAPGIE